MASLATLSGALGAEGGRFLYLDPAWLEQLTQTELRY